MKRIFPLALTLLVVAAPILGVLPVGLSAVGTASADGGCGIDEYQNDTDRYGTSDALMGQTGYRVGANTYDFTCEDLEDDLSYYQAASSLRSGYQSFEQTYDNSLSDTSLSAYSEMEKAVLYAYDNDTSLDNAQIEAKSAFEDYYTKKQINLLENYRAIMYGSESLENQSTYDMFTPGDNLDWDEDNVQVWYESQEDWMSFPSDYTFEGYDTTFEGVESSEVTLVNGTSYDVPEMVFNVTIDVDTENNGRQDARTTLRINPFTTNETTHDPVYYRLPEMEEKLYRNAPIEMNNFNIQPPPDTDHSTLGWLLYGSMFDRTEQLQQEYDNFNDAYESYTEGIYNGLDTGEISYSDAISRATQVDTYLQQATDENASFNIAAVGLAGAGLDGVAVENTSYMTVNMSTEQYDRNITRDGMLLSRGAPADGWEYGVEYNSDDIDGGQMFVDLDGEEYTINGTFTIETAYDADGNELDASDIENPDQDRLDTYDADSYVNLTQDLQDDINQLDEKLSDDDGAGGTTEGTTTSELLDPVVDAFKGLFGFVGSGVEGAIQGLIMLVVGLVAFSILLNALLP